MRSLKILLSCLFITAGLAACDIDVQMGAANPQATTGAVTSIPDTAASPLQPATATPVSSTTPTASVAPPPTLAPATPVTSPTTSQTAPATAAPGETETGPLTLADLPAGFKKLDLVQSGLSEEAREASPFTIEHAFAFYRPESDERVVGGTTRFANTFEKIAFDVALSNPQVLSTLVLERAKNVRIVSQEPLAAQVGSKSTGIAVLAEVDGELIRADIIGFRQSNAGAFVAVTYPQGTESLVSAQNLAQIMANRIK